MNLPYLLMLAYHVFLYSGRPSPPKLNIYTVCVPLWFPSHCFCICLKSLPYKMANSDTSDYETEEEMDAQTTALKAQLQYLSKYNAAEEIKSERYRREIQKMKSNLTKVRSSYEECMRNPRPLNLTVPLNLSMIKSNAEKM